MINEIVESGSGMTPQEDKIATKKLSMAPYHGSIDGTEVISSGRLRRRVNKGKRKSRAKKHRSGTNRKRTYKPYYKLSWKEKQDLNKRDEKRGCRRRKELLARGIPLAPHNTNQFLFEDRRQINLEKRKQRDDVENSDNDSELSSLSDYAGSEGDRFEFQAMWQAETRTYQDMTKEELIQRFIQLENDELEIERQIEEGRTKIKVFQEEIKKLESANEILSNLNAKRAQDLEYMRCKSEDRSHLVKVHSESNLIDKENLQVADKFENDYAACFEDGSSPLYNEVEDHNLANNCQDGIITPNLDIHRTSHERSLMKAVGQYTCK